MPSKTQSILLAGVAVGVIISLLTFVPTIGGCLACFGYLAAGLLAVWHYTNTYGLTIAGGQGAGMGALAGALSGLIAFGISWLISAVGLGPNMAEEIRRGLEQSGLEPEQVEQYSEMLTSPAFVLVYVVISLVLTSIVGAIGGAIGASMFKKGGTEPPAF